MAKPLSLIKLFVPFSFMLMPCLACPPHQKQSLLHFKSSLLNIFSTSNSSVVGLESWNSTSDCCTWTRVVCSSHARVITALHLQFFPILYYMKMNSSILDPIYGIRTLMLLDISSNSMRGEISGYGLANLTKLVHLDMSYNDLNGPIPAQLFHLKFLRFLDLSYNFALKGGLSSEVGKLGNLRTFNLEGNMLDGNIPVEIGNLTKLQNFSISDNKFSGGIPDSVGNLMGLERLDLRNNNLQMQIPNTIGNLFNLFSLRLSKNSFIGVIPPSILNLSKLETLNLEDNLLSGEIPSCLFDIKSLKNLNLGGNTLIWNNNVNIVPKCMLSQLSLRSCKVYGDIPEWISTQKNLDILELSDNELTGSFPLWLAEMEIGSILLSNNKLAGLVPSRLFQSPRLSFLALSRNNFSGELPENIGDAKEIMVLLLSRNNLSGPIPKSIADIGQLVLLDLSRNRFSGNTFPIFDPDGSLSYVDLSSNELSGNIPVSFCRQTYVLALGENKFSGELPENLRNMNELEYLDLHDNNITGSIPEFLSQISTLQVLSLRNNSLHGSLPSNSFSNQSSLRILDLSNNNLVGSIPSELGHLKGMSGTRIGYVAAYNLRDLLVISWVTADISLSSGTFTFTVEINDLMVNWKKAIQGLSSRNQHIYSLLDLSENKLSGEIPVSLGNLKGLKLLNISNNRLSGYIPESFGGFDSIETLDISNNNISGTIPQSLRKLNQLSVLDVSNNKLSGKIPQGGQMDTMNNRSYFANNSGLCGVQIRVQCLENEPTPNAQEEGEKEPWHRHLWTGVWVGFPLGFSSSLLTAFLCGYFVLPTKKYYSIQYRHR
ncbi:receptor-like protein 46 [Apium graveolens]|uniref:receptor-like protein 46 n=1 Tax=Apium graveolens TaxID=4045 RepID=UPI003D7B69CF